MNKHFYPIAFYYCLIFMSGSAYVSYIGLYYTDVGLDTIEIGIISALSAVIAIIVQPYWGLLSDRAKYKNNVLFVCIIVTIGGIWLIPVSNAFLPIVIFTLLFTVFHCAIGPISDTMTLELADKHRFKFSRIRTGGSIGFAIMSVLAGWLLQYSIYSIFALFSIIMLLALCLTPFIPKVKGHQREGKKVNWIEILKMKKLVYIYIYAFIIQATTGFFFAFHAIYSKEQGINTHLIGLGLMIGSISQFPFMIFFDRIYKRFGILNILIFSGFVHIVRWFLVAFAFTPESIIWIWMLHGGTFMLFYLCLAEYVNTNVIDELKSSGQMMNSIINMGISKVFGSLFGGISAAAIGIKYTFAICAVLCCMMVLFFWIAAKRSSVFRERLYDEKERAVSV